MIPSHRFVAIRLGQALSVIAGAVAGLSVVILIGWRELGDEASLDF
jgi:hypothetical protein